MPRSGDQYSLPYDWNDDAANGVDATAARFQAQDQDIADALTASSTIVKVQSGAYLYGGTAGGTADALTISLTPAISAYTTGMRVRLKAASTTTGTTPTLAVNGLTATTIVNRDGSALEAGDIVMGRYYELEYDGSGTKWLMATLDVSSFGRDLVGATSSTDALTLLGLVVGGTNSSDIATIGDLLGYEAKTDSLDAIAALTPAANKMARYTGTAAADLVSAGSTGISVLGGTSTAEIMTLLGAAYVSQSQTFSGGQASTITSETTTIGTLVLDFDKSNDFRATVEGIMTLGDPVNAVEGVSGVVELTQGTTGSKTVSYGPAWEYSGGTTSTPSLTSSSGHTDLLVFRVRSGAAKIDFNIISDVSQ